MQNYTKEWLVENHLIFVKLYEVDNDGLVRVMDDLHDMITVSTLPLVHIIVDLNDLGKYPTNLNEIVPRIKKVFSHERLGWYIHLTDNQMVGFLVQVTTSMHRVRARTFKTREQALSFLQEQDASLPNIQ